MNRSFLWSNFQAGTTTAVIIIPQGMAYALVAGVPAIHGLYASLLPLVVYAFIGRSRELAVGPGSLDTLLVGAALAGMGVVTESNAAAYAALLALLVGIIQMALGFLRAGFLVNFLSRPVLSGFTSAAALIIGANQVRNLLGFQAKSSAHFLGIMEQIFIHITQLNPWTAATGIIGIVLLIAFKRIHKKIPGPLVVVVLGIIAAKLLGLEGRGVIILGTVPSGFPLPGPPPTELFTVKTILGLLPTAFAIAFVGYMTMISIAKKFADMNRYDISANRELIASGGVNLMAGLSSGFPVSASFSRSAVHASAGSTSPYTLIVVAGWVAMVLILLTDFLYSLPRTILAAIIIVVVLGLVDFKTVRRLRKVKQSDMWLLLTTFAATLAIGIEQGILVGVACSLGLFIYRTTRPHTAVLGRVNDSREFRNVNNYSDLTTYPGMLILRFDAQFYFGNVTFLKDLLRRHEAEGPLKVVIIEACSMTQLDSSADAALHEIVDDYMQRGVEMRFASVKMPVMRVMKASGFYDKLGSERFFMNVDEAVRASLPLVESKGD